MFVHLCDTHDLDVIAIRDIAYPPAAQGDWIARIDGDPCLYIHIYRDGPREDPQWSTKFDPFGRLPALSIAADISSRHNGYAEVGELVNLLLTRIGGVAEDDDSPRLWSLPQILADQPLDGARFGGYWRDW